MAKNFLRKTLLEEAVENREWREINQDELSSTVKQLVMAEERAEVLRAELDTLKRKNEELVGDLVVLREVQLRQLERQNERLMETLRELYDSNAAAEAARVEAVREAEILRNENDCIRDCQRQVCTEQQDLRLQVQNLAEELETLR
ncbi:hypothetical protein Q1695_005578 [Nippostrongylus brasiliensis]|nr:hypothetical protein Q1695_005578 [Nippostrongylus brasiliensis]